jgi:hypothetical protein
MIGVLYQNDDFGKDYLKGNDTRTKSGPPIRHLVEKFTALRWPAWSGSRARRV